MRPFSSVTPCPVDRRGASSPARLAASLAIAGAFLAGCSAVALAQGGTCPPIPAKDKYTVGWAQISNNNAFRLTETDSVVA